MLLALGDLVPVAVAALVNDRTDLPIHAFVLCGATPQRPSIPPPLGSSGQLVTYQILFS